MRRVRQRGIWGLPLAVLLAGVWGGLGGELSAVPPTVESGQLAGAAPATPSGESAPQVSAPESVPDREALRERLDLLLEDQALGRALVGVEVRDCATGEVVYDRGAEQPLNPASNLKLLVTAVALETLGPAYRFKTEVLREGPIEQGILKGNLYLRGGGDPEWVYEAVWKMVQDLKALGLKGVEGDLIGDDTWFDTEHAIPAWKEDVRDGDTQAYNPPLSALSANFNTVAILVRPGEKVGAPVEAAFETPTQFVRLKSSAKTGKRRSPNSLRFDRIAVSATGEELSLAGSFPIDGEFKRYYRTVTDPPQFALSLLREMMIREGMTHKGSVLIGRTPDGATSLYTRYSSSLDILLRYMNKLSSNFIAEQLLKTLGAEVYGSPGTSEKGLMVLRDYLVRHKLGWENAQFYNASGLSTMTQVSSRQLVNLLCHVGSDFQQRYDFISTLPIGGVDGTMRRRMLGTPAAGRVRAKTGSVNGVFGFSGFLEAYGGRPLAFAFVVNELKGDAGRVKVLQDRWANVLVSGPGEAGATASTPVQPGENSEEGNDDARNPPPDSGG